MVVEYVAGIKTAWELAKAVKTATDSLDDAQLKLQIADLISALADAKIEAAESAEKISQLEKIINTKSNMEFSGSTYYKSEEGKEKDGPYCPTCYDDKSKEIRLKSTPGSFIGNWYCHVCSGSYE